MTIPALVIQMLETRLARKAFPFSVRPKPSFSNRAVESHSFKKASLVGAIHAMDGEDVWIRKETKLNL
jgi:hypothetical protein